MSTKNQNITRHAKAKKKINQEDNEIIEIEEIKKPKQLKSKKHKENIVNTSSESTTPNKKGQKKRDKTELIEIMDIEIPEKDSIPPKKKPLGKRQKRSVNKEKENERTKKNEKFSAKSASKLQTRGKSKSPLIKGRKKGKITNITLEESDNETEIKLTSVGKARTTMNRFIGKSPDNQNNKNKEITFNRNNKRKNGKKGKKDKKNEKEEEIIQCQLSEESDNEDIKRKNSRAKSKKKNNDNIDQSLNNLITRKSQKKLSKKKEDMKAKSAIKVILRNKTLNEKRNTLLGRKRKAENRNQKSKTPDKKMNKLNKLNSPIRKAPIKRNPSQLNKGKKKSKTPVRIVPKNNSKNNKNNLFMDQNSSRNCASPGLAVLNQLINEYGLEKVLDTLCKPKLEEKYKLDSCLKGLKDSCSDNKLPILLVKMLFSYIESKFDFPNKNKMTKRSTSAKKLSTFQFEKNANLKNSCFKSTINEKKYTVPKSDNGITVPMEIDDEENHEIPENKKIEKKNISSKVSSPKRVKSPLKNSSKKSEKKIMSIGSHYNKTKEGEIYKYQVSKLDGNGNAIFSCYDDKCSGMGLYELETKKFTVTRKHNLKHAEHEYIINFDNDEDKVFKDLVASERNDAQVFKENGERSVKIY